MYALMGEVYHCRKAYQVPSDGVLFYIVKKFLTAVAYGYTVLPWAIKWTCLNILNYIPLDRKKSPCLIPELLSAHNKKKATKAGTKGLNFVVYHTRLSKCTFKPGGGGVRL